MLRFFLALAEMRGGARHCRDSRPEKSNRQFTRLGNMLVLGVERNCRGKHPKLAKVTGKVLTNPGFGPSTRN
jgi:hypothetical protein